MLDHVVIGVSNSKISREFYAEALAPLGIAIDSDWGSSFSLSRPGEDPQLGFRATDGHTTPQHIAFRAESKEEVEAFHKAALRAGGKNNGDPGFRPQYENGYYAAFVLDPDGHNVEAVFHFASAN
ncbi:hypothetical protein AO994_30755 [Pseudomonas aeruginosa]|nr:hypothetical protein AO994_30755 [Pseudomonas aeruginosa]